ncbi:MAG: hypothetical protein AAF583_07325 [Pseudomonadota bacterium]
MQNLNAQSVVDEIAAHIQKQGGAPSDWYAGITSNVEQRVFGDHSVPRKDHWRIHRCAKSSDDARAAEKALLDWGCDGGGGGGDDSSVYVYAYLKSPGTRP